MGKLLLAVAVAAAWASVGRATAQDWPARPMTMVVPVVEWPHIIESKTSR